MQAFAEQIFNASTTRGNPMARVRCITEMGMGVDVHGRDATKAAARRAVSDAIRHSSLGFFRMVGKTSSDMFVDVTIGVPNQARLIQPRSPKNCLMAP
jgi:uncharacterized protein (TIGR02058 family)